MAYKVPMPRYGATMEEGLIAEWFVAEGDIVDVGQVLFSVEIEKLTNEVEAPAAGTVSKLLAREGDTIACGETVCIIETGNESGSEPETSAEDPSPVTAHTGKTGEEKTPASQPVQSVSIQSGSSSLAQSPDVAVSRKSGANITPKALQLAKELGVDFGNIRGTGLFGKITREDIRSAREASPASSIPPINRVSVAAEQVKNNPVQAVELKGARKIISQRMLQSLSEAAQAALWMDADITELMAQYTRLKPVYKQKGVPLSLTAIILKAVVQALQKHPVCRTQFTAEGKLQVKTEMHAAIAVDTPAGLMVPVLRFADRKTVEELSRELAVVSDSVKAGVLPGDDASDHVITISNLGMYGVTYSRPILNMPDSVILGVGTVVKRPVYIGDGLFARDILPLSLSFDHRIIDGGPAAAFLQDVCRELSACSIQE